MAPNPGTHHGTATGIDKSNKMNKVEYSLMGGKQTRIKKPLVGALCVIHRNGLILHEFMIK